MQISGTVLDYDAIIIGAGMSGLYQLYRLRELGLRVRVFEAGTNVGGTWYWNRYPGARFDSESYSYGYSFFEGIAAGMGLVRAFSPASRRRCAICNHVADKFDLRRDIQFTSRVTRGASTTRTRGAGTVTLEDGSRFTRALPDHRDRPAVDADAAAHRGRDSFKGESFHTARWPHEPVDFEGKRVAVIGTGATGVQTIQTIAETVGHLTVFQRTPNWCAPLHNGKIDAETQAKIKAGYPEMFARCQETFACFLHTPDPRGAFEVSDEEREAFYEKLYGERGFGIWQGNFRDILIDRKANATDQRFRRAQDPPAGEGPDGRRKADPEEPRLRHAAAAARDLLLRGLQPATMSSWSIITETPIERITPEGHQDQRRGIRSSTSSSTPPASTPSPAASTRSTSAAPDGARLKDKWKSGPQTYLGIMVDGFPNMMMLMGPHTALGNIPRSIEYSVDWVTGLIRFARDNESDAAGGDAGRRGVLDRSRQGARRRACCPTRSIPG